MTTDSDHVFVISKGFVRRAAYLSLVIAAIFIAAFLFLLCFVFMPSKWGDGPILAAEVHAPNGIHVQIVQRYTGDPTEPFEVGLFYRPPGEVWYYYPLEYGSLYWRPSISIDLGGRLLTIWNYGQPRAQLYVDEDGAYTFKYGGNPIGATVRGHYQCLPSGKPLDEGSFDLLEQVE